MSEAALPYIGFARNAFLNMIAFRLRYYTGVVNYLTFVGVNYFIWLGVFAGQAPGTVIKGYTLPEMITYVTVAWIARSLTHSDLDYTLNEMVKTGEVTGYLLRPVSFQFMLLAQALGEGIFRIFFLSLPVGLFLWWLFPIMPPASAGAVLYCLWSLFAGFLILSQINFVTGLTAFYLHSIMGVIRAKFYLVQLCSGLLLPLAFFPGWARMILDVLPFKYISFVPLQFYLGKIAANEIPGIIAGQAFWILALFSLGHLLWLQAKAKLTIQGG